MQTYIFRLVDAIRILLFVAVLASLYLSTRLSSSTISQAKGLALIYPKAGEVSAEAIERNAMLRKLSRRWNLFTIIDFSLSSMLLVEFMTGPPAANNGLQFYMMLHLPTLLLISFAVGFIVASVVIGFRSPFRSGTINPLEHLLQTLETLIEAAKPEEGGGHGYVDSILLRVVAQEIERFMVNREMGEAERGRLLEHLSLHDGVIGEIASSLLWPI
ncbi:MAG: hypothetical protein ACFFFC_11260 [Candidatus Thorarchaeota archaeon]